MFFKDYGFQYICGVFSLIGRAFEDFHQFLDANQVDGIYFGIEKIADGCLRYLVCFIFQPVNFNAVAQHLAIFLERRNSFAEFLSLSKDEVCKLSGCARRLGNVIENHPVTRCLN